MRFALPRRAGASSSQRASSPTSASRRRRRESNAPDGHLVGGAVSRLRNGARRRPGRRISPPRGPRFETRSRPTRPPRWFRFCGTAICAPRRHQSPRTPPTRNRPADENVAPIGRNRFRSRSPIRTLRHEAPTRDTDDAPEPRRHRHARRAPRRQRPPRPPPRRRTTHPVRQVGTPAPVRSGRDRGVARRVPRRRRARRSCRRASLASPPVGGRPSAASGSIRASVRRASTPSSTSGGRPPCTYGRRRVSYEYLLRVHLSPTFGRIAIGRITPSMVQVWR